tara:strand:- start:279 stop:533 length:255 start_codon:yes stop_codon:yes gene_type:complete
VSNPLLNATNAIVESNGTMSQAFRTWTISASLSIPIVGTGSPEGALEARQYQLYIDSTGAAGAIEYRKMLPDIGGDRTQGWILV